MTDKQAVRERVWALLERRDAARFPGARGRILWDHLDEEKIAAIPALAALGP